MSFIPDACDTQVPSEAQIEAAWRAFENCPIDLVGDSDEEQKKCVIAAVKAALASPVETVPCTICAAEESPGFYKGCMVKDGHAPEWNCDGKGNLTRRTPHECSSAAAPVEPYAWVIPGDDQSRPSGSIDAMAWREGEFTKPLYAQPPAAPVETLDFETALRQALDDLTVEDGKCNWAEVANILPRMRGELRAAAQPVAWRWRFEDQEIWRLHRYRPPHADDSDVICEPLYAAPVETAPLQNCSADSGGEWRIQQSVPSDGFECYYLLRDDVVVAEICGPQKEQRTRHLNALVIAANSSAEPQIVWRPIDTAPKGPTISVARKGGQRDDGSSGASDSQAMHRSNGCAGMASDAPDHLADHSFSRGLPLGMDTEAMTEAHFPSSAGNESAKCPSCGVSLNPQLYPCFENPCPSRAPEVQKDCEACDGKGYIAETIHVYERGCGFSHPDVDEKPCQACSGNGWFVSEAEVHLMTKTRTHSPADLSCAADFLDDIEVDESGKCEWTAVANAQTHIRAVLRCWSAAEPQSSAETAIAALAKRFWSIHPKEIQDLGITREQFYEREMLALFATHHMTYEQLEYVARAIFCADGGWLREWLAIDQDHRNYYMRLAKAAADAMPRT